MDHSQGFKYALGLRVLKKELIVFVCKALKMEQSNDSKYHLTLNIPTPKIENRQMNHKNLSNMCSSLG